MLPANGALLKALAVPTELAGRLNTGLRGENSMGEYRVVPFDMAEPQHLHVLIEERELRCIGKLPVAESVWVIIDEAAQWPRVQDADVVVWRVENPAAAQALATVLAQGVSMPLVVYAAPDLLTQYGAAWRAAGAHALVAAEEIAQV